MKNQIKPVSNSHRVPKKIWARWSNRSRRVFNDVFKSMNGNQSLFLHPATKPVPAKQWRTTAWNAAWIAAGSVHALGAIDAQGDGVVFRKVCCPCGK